MWLVSTDAGDEHKRDGQREAQVVENAAATAPLMWVGNTVVICSPVVGRERERGGRMKRSPQSMGGSKTLTAGGSKVWEYESMQWSSASHY